MNQVKELLAKELGMDIEELQSPAIRTIIDQTMTEVISRQFDESSEKGSKKKITKQSIQESAVDRLKNYITKCGVRKIWKKELDGLSEKEQIQKLQSILKELGMEGRPTLEKCKKIKERREFEKEVEELHNNTILDKRLRNKRSLSIQEPSPETTSEGEPMENSRIRSSILAFGDQED